ncbi:MAG: hypothetical protein P8L72_00600 [Flavobacteriaceae bacterium]|nr:hypothetical protein [Flavobacteriaceae bacterium]MDG2313867.1 hypothetical protein [Flavobacteriaceae bacterium]
MKSVNTKVLNGMTLCFIFVINAELLLLAKTTDIFCERDSDF